MKQINRKSQYIADGLPRSPKLLLRIFGSFRTFDLLRGVCQSFSQAQDLRRKAFQIFTNDVSPSPSFYKNWGWARSFTFWALAIVTTFLFYLAGGVPEHFFKHFFIGASVGLFVLLIDFSANKKYRRNWWQLPLWLWIFAIIPDILHSVGYEGHLGAWINIFLLHNIIDRLTFIEVWLGGLTVIELLIFIFLRKRYAKQ